MDNNRLVFDLSERMAYCTNYTEVDRYFKDFLFEHWIDLLEVSWIFLKTIIWIKNKQYKIISTKLLFVVKKFIEDKKKLGYNNSEISEMLKLKNEKHISYLINNIYVSKNIMESCIGLFDDFK